MYMRQLLKVLGKTEIPYYQKGETPRLLIHAGTHGDEYGVIESVKLAVDKYEDRLPDFIFVPVVSPSAVGKKTRVNGDNIDLNRNFFEESTIGEVEANFQIVRGNKFETLVTFHEDIEPEAKFYLYDTGWGIGESDSWKTFKGELMEMGVGLLNGSDDPNDPTLNFTFSEGYHYWSLSNAGYQGGSFDAWLSRNGLVSKILVPEIPAHLNQTLKNKTVDLFFNHFLLKS